ncbi:MAG: hypothetical protein K9L82_17005 [Chromatiaceae bacterium]|nr:hypothetical protein [Chromatiaceae bacterium]MCF7993856.1 hypothetical protein [Chromatiaceae bacterium]MCF8003876.1 hypothetical protein [Chromatiaceae bacterium]MCF8017149.1 hypothetical protein [Chromatiaceae bacterium]
MAKKNQPRAGGQPKEGKQVRRGGSPENFDRETVCWQAARADWEHDSWGWHRLTPEDWHRQVRDKLCSLESMTWAQLRSASGGRSYGTNHHAIPIGDLSREAQKRLEQLNLDDIDELWSLRLAGTVRVFGIKDGRVFRALWFDRDHGVCPSVKRGT